MQLHPFAASPRSHALATPRRAGHILAIGWLCAAMPLALFCAACGDDKGNDGAAVNNDAPADAEDGPDIDDGDDDAMSAPDAVTEGRFELSNGVSVAIEGGQVSLTQGERALAPLALSPLRTLSYTEEGSGPAAIWEYEREDEARTTFSTLLAVENGDDEVSVSWREGDATAKMVVTPGPVAESTQVTISLEGASADSIEVAFDCGDDAAFMGFGEQYNAVEQRGEAFELMVSEQGIGRDGSARAFFGDEHTTYFPMPWWIDAPRGYGVLFDTPYRVRVDICAADADEAVIEVTDGAPVSYVVFHGPTSVDVIDQLGAVVGRPKRPPTWAFGAPWISAQGGTEAVRAIIAQLEAEEVPYGAIWSQDWTGERRNIDGGLGVQYRWNPDEEHYPGLRQLADDLHADGKRFLGYANPFIPPNLPDDHFDAMDAAGQLIQNANGETYVFGAPNGLSSHPDFTQAETRAYVEGELVEMVEVHGFDGWMADFAEWNPIDAVHADGTDGEAAHNLFPVWWHAANRAAMDRARPDGDWVLFARSGWTGVQAHTMIHWVGDQEATWEESDGLPTVVPAMLNLGLAGVPYVTHDIAGFSGGPSTKELFMRWVELGAFTPIMRTHEGNRRQENHNWNTDAETIAHFKRFAQIHLALAPEWEALADAAEARSTPMVRALALHYPDDPEARVVSDQFLIGESLLVAPVVEEGATERRVYLPAGTWFHVFTGEAFDGPGFVTVEAPLGTPPVFNKDADRDDLRAIE